jgi:glutamate synthase (NADPH/NADH) small chain
MGKPTGFFEFRRIPPERRDRAKRINDYLEVYKPWSENDVRDQGARCMNCAIPFCHKGCPLGNLIPDWNDLVYKGKWKEALNALLSTNNFPEFTGRICPAPCEASCVLSINEDPVTIEHIEWAISERGFDEGWVEPFVPPVRTGKNVAVVGSGPSGLAAAQQLNRAGHLVVVFEREDYIGGLLRIGIPEFKLEKRIVKRRIDMMEKEEIKFKTGVNVGFDITVAELNSEFDAICLTGGATKPRDLPIAGRDLEGVYFAMEYLSQQNKIFEGQSIQKSERITAEGKRVVILGGGDTGADCLGTAHRQGAEIVMQYELLPEPPVNRLDKNPWPEWPIILRTSAAHQEGGLRDYNILTKSFSGSNNKLQKLHAVRVNWGPPDETGRPVMQEIEGSEFELEVDLVLLAMGFTGPEPDGMLSKIGVELNERGNVKTDKFTKMTNVPGVFAAGDMSRGQSLVVWAIAEGRHVASCIDQYLMGSTSLPKVL